MKKIENRLLSVILSVVMMLTVLAPAFVSSAAGATINITDSSGNDITEIQQLTEYNTLQLAYTTSEGLPEGTYVKWESNLPLLADVDDTGKVTAYDSSKTAIIQLWLDENIRVLPLVGDSLADSIMSSLESSGTDLDSMNDEMIVAIVRGIVGDTLADSLAAALASMNVEITATLYDKDGNKLASDTIKVKVNKSVVANVLPTGTHITNKKSIPLTVAVGKTVQLYAAVTPVRLEHTVTFAMGSNVFDTTSSKHATVSSDGLVTFTSAGTVTVRAYDSSNVLFVDTVTFTVVEQSELPVTSFDIISGTKTVTDSTVSVAEGATTQLAITNVVPAGAYTGDLSWSSADSSIAVIDGTGTVTGLDGGTSLIEYSKSTTVTATAGGVSKNATIKVTRSAVTGSLSSVEIVGDSVVPNDAPTTYTSEVFPARLNSNSSITREWGLKNSTTGDIIWATSAVPAETELATMTSSGVLTPKLSGIITIATKATLNGKSVESTLNVTAGKAITDFTISGSTSVKESKTTQLSLSGILPDDYDPALLSTVVWTSADPTIATVDSTGLVKGIDAGGTIPTSKKSVNITARIGSVSKTVTVTVTGNYIGHLTGVTISGNDYVIRDFPVTYSATFSPARVTAKNIAWGLSTDEGAAPWTAKWDIGTPNQQNSVASVDSNGVVTGLGAGSTKVYVYGRQGLTNVDGSYVDTSKDINVIEIEPKGISITPPSKTNYVEGNTDLDLTGMEIKLTYDRADIAKYYGEEAANALTDAQLSVTVTDYSLSEVNTDILDKQQYVIVDVTRAGKTYHTTFAITIASKAVTSIDLENPQYKYAEGDTDLNLDALKVKANYSNADSEYVTGYTVDTASFNPATLDVEQNIKVIYTHAGRSAEASFPVIIYGKPVVSVDSGAYSGGWTSDDVTFTLSSTHILDGVTYYYKTDSDPTDKAVTGNTLTISSNSNETYYFKAVNSEGITSDYTEGYNVKRDDVTPSFTLTQAVTDITNQSYAVSVSDVAVGASGVSSVTLNGADITADYSSFTVDQNGTYTVVITADNGLSKTESVVVNNIDKTAPTVNSIKIENVNGGGFANFINTITFGKFFNQKVKITINATDEGVAGLDKIEYRFLDENGLPVSPEWLVYDSSSVPTQDPNFKGSVEARATDKATNVSEVLFSEGYVIDGDDPTDVTYTAVSGGNTYTSGEWTSGDVTVTLNSTAFSGIYKYYYRIDSGAWQELTGNIFTATETGEHKYEFKSISYSALDSEITEMTIKIDRQTPVIRVTFEGTFGRWSGDGASFSFSTEEASISGITYYYDNGSGWTEITSGATIDLTESVNASYRFKAVNGAGTASYPSDSYRVMIDAKVPEITLTPENTDATQTPYKINVATVVGNAGLKEVTFNGTDITGQDFVTVSKNGTYVFTVVGNNGKVTTKTLDISNFVEKSLVVTGVSFTSPVKVTNETFGKYYNSAVSFTVLSNAADKSEYLKIEYRLVSSDNSVKLDWTEYNETSLPKVPSQFKGYVEARIVDNFNRVSQVYRTDGITVDSEMPSAVTVSAENNGVTYDGTKFVSGDIKFTLSASSFSGISEYQYKCDNSDWQTISGNTVSVNKDGEHKYSFRAVANNTVLGASSNFSVKQDSSVPAVQIAISGVTGAMTDKDVVFTLSSANSVSGATYYYKTTESDWQVLTGNTLTVSKDTNTLYKFKAVNLAGTESIESPEYLVFIDKTAPSISAAAISSEFTSGSVSIAIVTSGVTSSQIASVTMNGADVNGLTTVDVSENGTYSFVLTTVNGKTAETTVEIKNIDNKTPSLSVNAYGKTGDWTTGDVTFVLSSDAISGASYLYNDGTGYVALNSNSLTVSENCNKTYTFKAVNGVNAESAESNAYAVMIDKSSPSFKTAYSGNSYVNSSVDITISDITTGISGIKSMTVNGAEIKDMTKYTANSNGDYVFTLTAGNGNSYSTTVTVSGIDKAAPTLSDFTMMNSDGTAAFSESVYKTALSFTVNANDAGGSGIKSIEYRTLNKSTGVYSDWMLYDKNNLPKINGYFWGIIEVRATDNAGNVSRTIQSKSVVVSKDAPIISYSASNGKGAYQDGKWSSSDITVTLSATALDGISFFMVKTDNGMFEKLSGNSFTALDGEHTYAVKAVSKSGLESEIKLINTKIEKGAPKLTVTPSGNIGSWAHSDVTFSLSATNASSGVTYYYDDGAGFKEISGNTFSVTENTVKTYKFKAVNGAGTESAVSSGYSVMLDKTNPTGVTVTAKSGDKTVANGSISKFSVTMSLSSEAFSDIAKYQYSLNGGAWADVSGNSVTASGDGKYSYRFRAVSKSGLVSDEEQYDVQIRRYLYGDTNDDGKVDVADAILIMYYVQNSVAFNAEQKAVGDLNKDGVVDEGDAVLIMRYDAGLISEFSTVK